MKRDDNRNLNDYGRPEPTPIGVPKWKRVEDADAVCPNCGAALCEVSVEAESPLLVGGRGICTYLSCPACPFASPSITRAAPGKVAP